jgi:hypothetical protein
MVTEIMVLVIVDLPPDRHKWEEALAHHRARIDRRLDLWFRESLRSRIGGVCLGVGGFSFCR